MSAPEPIAFLRRRGLLVAVFALAACDSDTTPIAHETVDGPEGERFASMRDPGYKLGANDRLRITVFGQPTLTGEYTLDGNGVLAFPLIGNLPAAGMTTE